MRHLDVLHMNICLCNSFGAHKPNKVLRPLCYMNCQLFCCWRLWKIAHLICCIMQFVFECFSMFHIAIKMIWFDLIWFKAEIHPSKFLVLNHILTHLNQSRMNCPRLLIWHNCRNSISWIVLMRMIWYKYTYLYIYIYMIYCITMPIASLCC